MSSPLTVLLLIQMGRAFCLASAALRSSAAACSALFLSSDDVRLTSSCWTEVCVRPLTAVRFFAELASRGTVGRMGFVVWLRVTGMAECNAFSKDELEDHQYMFPPDVQFGDILLGDKNVVNLW